jgi:polysaccharide export outer membrane protein
MLPVAEKMFRYLYTSALLLSPVLMTAQMNAPREPAMHGRVTPVAPITAGQDSTAARSVSPAGSGSGITVAPATGNETSASPATPLSSEILIGPGDLLEVSVFGADYTKQVRVSGTGEITLPFTNNVKVSGLTTSQAEALIAKRLSDGGYFNDPKVSVLDKEFATQGVSVLGEVQKPGTYPMPGPRNLFDALSAAGGLTQRAGNTVWVTHRSQPQQPEVISLANGKDSAQQNIQVYPGDTVVVSKAGIVYVVGDVRLPGGFIMESSRMTVLQAVAMAQGPNPTAALDSARLIRKSAATTNGPQEIGISLKKIMSAKSPDMDLQAEDILFVPASAAKTAGRRTIDAIIQTATGMAVYGRIP